MNDLATAVIAKAHQIGFNMVGFVPAAPSPYLAAYHQWIGQQMHGEMGYLARPDRLARRQDLNVILPGVQTLICVGLEYFTAPLPAHIANDPSRGRISNYAWGGDYHQLMTPRLQQLADWLAQQRPSTAVQNRVYVDTGAIQERDHAHLAGLGFTGKNSMLIHPQRGSFFFLGELLTTLDIPAPATAVAQLPSCGRCHRCLDACPTAAFPQPYVLDARRCISYLTIELKGWLPLALRPLMGNWVYGCDICQQVCPFNRFSQPSHEPSFAAADWDQAAPPLLQLLALDDETFTRQFAHSPIKRIKRYRLVRNAAVAAGNWGDPTAVPLLSALLHDPHPLVRGHAAWALRRIGGVAAETAVAAAAAHETDADVLTEISQPLAPFNPKPDQPIWLQSQM